MSRREVLRSLLGVAGGLGLGASELVADSVRPDGPAGPGSSAGPGAPGRSPRPSARALEPFRIDFPPEAIRDLRLRIDRTRWPDMPFDTGWSAGTHDEVLRELADYWRNDYDWPAIQDRLNEHTHLRGTVADPQPDGRVGSDDRLHCVIYPAGDLPSGAGRSDSGDPADAIQAPTTRPAGLPLLLLHGWPGTFHEFNVAAPLLAAGIDGASGFDVVVPSLPGFAFSDPPSAPGMNPTRIAQRLHALMLELGHERYGVQGGDWGAIIGTQMARLYPGTIVGLHLNFVSSAPPPPEGIEPSPEEIAYREYRARFQYEETGYSSIQGTRPQSLGYAQQDSPVGWLAWMVEKYWAWSDHGDDLWETFSRDDLLTTAMLYWMPRRILSAARIYYETFNPAPGAPSAGGRVEVPTGYARFPAEPWGPPREVVERTYNLVRYSEPERGGHFPALEQPETWANEVGGFFAQL